MSTKERMQQYIDKKGITAYRVEKDLGKTNGYWKKTSAVSADVLGLFTRIYSDVSPDWLLNGEGDMLRTKDIKNTDVYQEEETRPRIPVAAAAGSLSGFAACVNSHDCELIPVVKSLPSYDFTMIIKGDSMEPKFEGGDEIAIRKVACTIEWGKTYVLDTRDGAVIKRLYDEGDKFRCVSYNKEYPDFTIEKSDVFGIYKVVGLIRI